MDFGKVPSRITEKFSQIAQKTFCSILNNPLLVTYIAVLTILFAGMLQTMNFIPVVIGSFVLGGIMISGGIIILLDYYVRGESIGFSITSFEDMAGFITGILGTLYGIGLLSGVEFLKTHFGGVQGGIILFILSALLWSGYKNFYK